MKLGEKLAHAKRAIESITRHDDVSVAIRRQAADVLLAHVEAELDAALEREKAQAAAQGVPSGV